MEIMTYKQHLFFNIISIQILNICPTILQVPGNLQRKILLVAVGTMRALLFQPHHHQESVLPKDDVLKGQTTGNSGCYSVDGDPPLCSDDVFDALQHFRRGDLHQPTGSMFVFDTCPPFRELLHPIMDCLM